MRRWRRALPSSMRAFAPNWCCRSGRCRVSFPPSCAAETAMRVLVVDGDPAGAREMETILRAAGHELVDATAGPDVVFLDHDLGIEMARRLRERCRGRIVLTTTRTDARTLAGIESFR